MRLAEQQKADFEYGQQVGEEIANAVDGVLAKLVDPWCRNLTDTFTTRVATTVIFSDDPAPEARAEVAEFYDVVDAQFTFIEADIRSKLVETELKSREWDIVDEYELLLKSRFSSISLDLRMRAMNIAADVVIARNEELGSESEEDEPLLNGRSILKNVRAMEVPLA